MSNNLAPLRIVIQHKGGIDNKNESTKYSHSLGKEQRKRELQRITKENQKILRRIQDARPTYNHCEWEEDAKKNEDILANISEFKTRPLRNSERTLYDDESFFRYMDIYDAIPE